MTKTTPGLSMVSPGNRNCGIAAVALAAAVACVAQWLSARVHEWGPSEEGSATAPSRVRSTFGRCGRRLRMDCHGVESCGVLVVQTGRGQGHYRHASPSVHGLWPQTCEPGGCYGNSVCVPPRSFSVLPSFLPRCYDHAEARKDSSTLAQAVGFVAHEWSKHGACSGVLDEQDYFAQVYRCLSYGLAHTRMHAAAGRFALWRIGRPT